MKPTSLLFLLASAICVAPMRAEDAPNPVSVSAYFLTPAWFGDRPGPPPIPEISIRSGDSWLPLESRWGVLGVSEEVPWQPEWNLRLSVGDESPSREMKLPVPTGSDSLLLVIFPQRNNEFHVIPVDGSIGRLPTGNVYFINAGDEAVAVNASRETKTLEVGETWRVPTNASMDLQIKTRIAAQIKDKWRLVYRRSIFVDPQKRYIFLIHRQGLTGSAWSTTLLDFTPPASLETPLPSTEEAL